MSEYLKSEDENEKRRGESGEKRIFTFHLPVLLECFKNHVAVSYNKNLNVKR